MAWIKTISFDEARGRLKKIYDRLIGPDKKLDNILTVHSLRPHSLEGHLALYKNVLHHSGNTLDKWFLEAIGVYVSMLNKCDYCVNHHFAGMTRILNDNKKSFDIRVAFEERDLAKAFDAKEVCAFEYAQKLTCQAQDIDEHDIIELRRLGFDDGQILEINQVTAYFNYANRTVLGLGVSLTGDILGLSPNNSDDNDDWSHR